MSAIALIAYAICSLIISPSVKSVEGCTRIHPYRYSAMETDGPSVGPVAGMDPSGCSSTYVMSRVGSHDMSSYVRLERVSRTWTKMFFTKMINVDFIRDVQLYPDGGLEVAWGLYCDCLNEPKTVFGMIGLRIYPVDNYPPEFLPNTIVLNLTEDTPIGATVANIRDQVIDRDYPDFTRITNFSINPDPSRQNNGYGTFQISSLGVITLSKSLDYDEGFRTYQLNVSAKNNVSQTANGNVTVNVINVNDHAVTFVYRNCRSGCTYVFEPTDPNQDPEIRAVDGDNDPIEYSIHLVLPASERDIMTINKTTGKLRQLQHPHNLHLRTLTLIIKLQYQYNVTYVSELQDYSVRVYSLPPFGPEHKDNISTFVSYRITTKREYSTIPGKWYPLVDYQVFSNGTVSFNLSVAPAHLNLTMFRVYIKKQNEAGDSVFSEVCYTENRPEEDFKCVFTHTVEDSGRYYITGEAIDKFPKVNGLCQCWIYNPQRRKVCDNCRRIESSRFSVNVIPTLGVPECTNPHIAMRRMPETIGPEAGPIVLIGPQTGEPGILSRLRDHDLDSYFTIQAKGGGRSEVYLNKTLNVDFITDVDRLDDGELVLPFMVSCRCVKCYNANGPVTIYHGYLIVSPVDNYPPEIGPIPLNVSEDTPIGSIVGNISNLVFDRDFPDYTKITRFSLIDQHGIIQALANGDITLSKALDYEAGNRTYQVGMSATNNISQTANGTVTVNVINVNDNPVRFVFTSCSSQCIYVLNTSTATNQDAGIRAMDADNDPIEYSIIAVVPVNETGVMAINKTTGRLRQLKYPDDRHLRTLRLTIKARVTSPLPPARITHGRSLDEDFANVTIYFEIMSRSVSGGDQVLAGHLHVPVCLIMIYGISKHVI